MIGVDIVKIERIKRAVEQEGFLNRVYTSYEADYAMKKPRSIETLAGIFAAKEAAVKALKTGFNGINFKDVCVYHDDNGCPYIMAKNQRLSASISHDGEYAIAIACIDK